MSSIKQLAEAEADAVEAELGPDNPDEEPVEPIEPEETETESAVDESQEKQLADLAKKIGAEAKRHENALAKLRPDDWEEHVMCPLCVGDGFLLPIPPGAMPDQLWEAVRALAGRQDDGVFPLASYSEVCDECKGYGMVRTGALNETNAAITCKPCKGYGWFYTGPLNPGEIPPPNMKPQATGSNVPQGVVYNMPTQPDPWPDHHLHFIPVVGGLPDPWNRPAGHPRWGADTTESGTQLPQPAARTY